MRTDALNRNLARLQDELSLDMPTWWRAVDDLYAFRPDNLLGSCLLLLACEGKAIWN